MSIAEIENEIKKLPFEKVDELMAWFSDYHAQLWDRQIEGDLASGRLNGLLADVDEEIEATPSMTSRSPRPLRNDIFPEIDYRIYCS